MFKDAVKLLLLNGCSIDYCKVSLCNLNQFMERQGFQVTSDNPIYYCSEIYPPNELDNAVSRFCFITRLIRNEYKRQSEELQRLSDEVQSS